MRMPLSAANKGSIGGVKETRVALPEGTKKVDGLRKAVSVSKQNSATAASKPEVGKNPSSTSTKTVTKTTAKVKAEKKVYSLPGQKYDAPEEREPLRIFYETLSKQIPSSEMAEFWLMEHGLLSPDHAKKAYERKQRRQQQLRMGTPMKSTKQERMESSKPQVSKNGDVMTKKRINYSDNDDDFIVKHKKQRDNVSSIWLSR